jgi:hypothetical protein
MVILAKSRPTAFLIVAAVAIILPTFGCAPDANEVNVNETLSESQPSPSVTITQPADGAVIEGNSVLVAFQVSDLRIVPAGTQEDGTGHHHIIVDSALPAPGVPIPATPGVHIHLGAAQTEFELTDLTVGEHTVLAVVGDWMHVPLDPWVIDTVKFVVQ